VRPLARRRATMARPARVRIRMRNPCFFARLRLFGWNVRFTTTAPHQGGKVAGHARASAEGTGATMVWCHLKIRNATHRARRRHHGRLSRHSPAGIGVASASTVLHSRVAWRWLPAWAPPRTRQNGFAPANPCGSGLESAQLSMLFSGRLLSTALCLARLPRHGPHHLPGVAPPSLPVRGCWTVGACRLVLHTCGWRCGYVGGCGP
jgi:hypothetical protein